MKFRRQKREEFAVNLTPLIDVVFLLLIFFMVSTRFSSQTELDIELPEATLDPVAGNDKPPLEIRIDKQGQYALDGVLLASLPALRQALAGEPDTQKQLPVTIAADGAVQHQHVVSVLGLLTELGFRRASIAAESPTGEAGE
jgi:biopolymer transport protein ExbD